MIEVEKALSIIENNTLFCSLKKIKVSKSLGYVLAEDIFSPIDMPPFRQSAMDGYAFTASELTTFKIVDTIQAGSFTNIKPASNEAVRIFTGAFVPDTLDTVVMQEHTSVSDSILTIDKLPSRFANVRNQGEQIKKGELVVAKNTLINPALIGYLACLGISEISVYKKPKIAIVVTGNELVELGKKLPKGKIYESNSLMLEAALQEIGINEVTIIKVKDNLTATQRALKKCLSKFDVVLVSGGISVGDYDFVKEALLDNNVEELFYKINQKPGKPLFFGKKENKIVFALPGNPASSLTCFYVYVLRALKNMMGFNTLHLPQLKKKINSDFANTTGKSLFLKAFYTDDTVTILESQSSAMLNTFATSNGLIFIPHDVIEIKKDQEVLVIPINN
jgi:molybdopterin molybdotransferase